MKKFCLIFLWPAFTLAQPYLAKEGKTRHRFAQTVFGFDLQCSSGGHSFFVNPTGNLQPVNSRPRFNPRIYISGTHFWGHAEFYFAFQLPYREKTYQGYTVTFSQSDIFGTKIYPWAIMKKKMRPYVGFSISGLSFYQGKDGAGGNGPLVTRLRLPLISGLTYCSGKYLWEIGINYNYNNQLHYYFSPQTSGTVNAPALLFHVGLRRWIETTTGLERDYQDGTTEKHYNALKLRRRLSSWFIGIGPSSAFFVKNSPYNAELFPFMDKPFATFFSEFSAGYYNEPLKSHLAFSYRHNGRRTSAYGHTQVYTRSSLSLEAVRYLTDYNGFNPYIGGCLSYEWLGFSHSNSNLLERGRWQGIKPGLIFGWDILPDKLQWLMLRTNLRYFPDLRLGLADSKTIFLDQLEFNFIQVIFYPQRFRHIMRE